MREAATLEKPWFARWPPDLPRSLIYPDVPVQDLLRRTAGQHGDRPAVTFYGKTLTYRDLDAAVDRFAAGLRTIGVRAGDRVSLLLPNTPHFMVAFFAVVRAGAIVVQTNPILTPRELEVLWNDAGVETVVALDLFWHNVSKAKAGTQVQRVVVCDAAATAVSDQEEEGPPEGRPLASLDSAGTVDPSVRGPREDAYRFGADSGESGQCGGPAVYRRDDRDTEGRDAHPSESRRERRPVRGVVRDGGARPRARPRRDPPLSRVRADRGHAPFHREGRRSDPVSEPAGHRGHPQTDPQDEADPLPRRPHHVHRHPAPSEPGKVRPSFRARVCVRRG